MLGLKVRFQHDSEKSQIGVLECNGCSKENQRIEKNDKNNEFVGGTK